MSFLCPKKDYFYSQGDGIFGEVTLTHLEFGHLLLSGQSPGKVELGKEKKPWKSSPARL